MLVIFCDAVALKSGELTVSSNQLLQRQGHLSLDYSGLEVGATSLELA
jgi:hypothetical protein